MSFRKNKPNFPHFSPKNNDSTKKQTQNKPNLERSQFRPSQGFVMEKFVTKQKLVFTTPCAMILKVSISKKQTIVFEGISLILRWELMKKELFSLLSTILLVNLQTAYAADDPQLVHAGTRILQSGGLVVEIGDPDSPDCRWNRGQRFSPVANIIQVTLNGLEFCYAPVNGGSLSYLGGLPMEFDIGQESFQPDPPGYNEGTNGSPFLKIGVGILRRNSSEYNFSSTYPVIELAQTTTP